MAGLSEPKEEPPLSPREALQLIGGFLITLQITLPIVIAVKCFKRV